jgi:hypothetical protein
MHFQQVHGDPRQQVSRNQQAEASAQLTVPDINLHCTSLCPSSRLEAIDVKLSFIWGLTKQTSGFSFCFVFIC